MISLAPIRSATSAIGKYLSHPLIALPLCLSLIGCDSVSSNDNKEITSNIASVDHSSDTDTQSVAEDSQDKTIYLSRDDNEANEVAKGQSLISVAQSNNDSQPSSMDSEPRRNSLLHATLMGDYGGMVSCASCDSIDITLNLFADGSVLKTSLYHNPKQPREPLIESGIYRQDDDTITIVYEKENIETYRIRDNHLILLNKHKQLNNDYTLSRK